MKNYISIIPNLFIGIAVAVGCAGAILPIVVFVVVLVRKRTKKGQTTERGN